jgi:tetratricopeptide (TPR) repeat protein
LAAFQRGIDLYRTSQYARAAEAFAGAAQFDPSSALYLYFEALARRQAGQADAAQQCIERATELEKSHPVAGRGQAMERYQGPARRWLERARAEALKVR